MGHKVNPEIFRLGHSVDWKYQLRDPLLANIFIYKTVKRMFLHYSAPYVRYIIRRKVNPRTFIPKRLNNKMIRNPFLRNSFIFSHLNISYTPSLHLAIFLLDGKAERHRISKKRSEDSLYYLSGKFFPNYGRYKGYFLKQMYQLKKPLKVKFATKWYHYDFLYKVCWDHFGKIEMRSKEKIKLLKARRRFFLRRKPLYGIWIGQMTYTKMPFNSRISVSVIRKLLFLLRFRKFIKKSFSKKRIFLINLLLVTSTTLLLFLKKNMNLFSKVLSKRLFLFIIMCNVYLTKFKYMHLQYNKRIFRRRLLIYKLYSKILTFTLYKAMFIPTDRRVIIKFFGLNNRNLNAHFLLNYFTIKLGQYFQLKHIINPIIKRLKRLDTVEGFRFVFAGRLTRKQRAAYIVKKSKSMPLSTYKARVDYASGFKVMKYGVVGIKVYLLLSEHAPYYYFFEFRNKI